MEELENKLNLGNPVLIAHVFSKILEIIQSGSKSGIEDSPEFKFLKDKCMVADPLISEVAGTGVVSLVKNGVLPIDITLTDFITTIPLTKCYKCLISIIGNLLHLEMQNKILTLKEYTNRFNLWLPQHPYITILNEDPTVWSLLLNEIKYLHRNEKSIYINEIFRPVYLYALCSPFHENILLKQNTWNFILKEDLDQNIFFDIIGLLQIESRNSLELNSELLSEALLQISSNDEKFCNIEVLILWQTSFLYNLAVNKFDLRPCIFCLNDILEDIENLITINCLLLILSKTITICSPVYLLDLLNLCEALLCYQGIEIYVLETLKTSLLYWLVGPSMLTAEAVVVAKNIFTYIENFKAVPVNSSDFECLANTYRRLINTNNSVFISVEICLLLPKFTNEKNVIEWVEQLEQCPYLLVEYLYNFLCGLFLSKNLSPETHIKIFEIILKHIELNRMLCTELLTIILYKLSNTKSSKVHFVLLKALPKMVILKANLPKVVATLQALSKGSVDLYNLSLSLMYEVWKIHQKCYTPLEKMLIQQSFSGKKWETYVTKAFILKELCERKPELYGKELVAHLSKILNECNDDDGSLSCAIAIDGIRILCKAEIIDVVTTWGTLAPKFKNDMRIPVIKSLCLLIHEIPHLPYTESYTQLQEEVVKTLWDYVETAIPEITESALNGLTSFSLEQICSQLPDQYLDENALQERKRVVGIPQTVPGRTWVKFLIENKASKEACNFIIKMISIEVAGYLKYVYQVKGHREPINYDYLPTYSIVRGIGEFIKTWVNKWRHSIHDLLYIECIKIFSKEYSKPLPPLDWCFLQELLHDDRIKKYCIDIASQQAVLSGTARRLMENYIEAVTKNFQENDILNVFKNLKHLANSIQPVILKPFFENTLAFSIEQFETGSKELLEKITDFIAEVLLNANIQETNKTTIAQVLFDKIYITNTKSELFSRLLKCVIVLPKKCIEEITTLKPDMSEEWFEKVTKIRCSIAIHTNVAPLTWLSEIIEISSTMRRNMFIFEELITVFRKHINNPSECALWLLELIGQIQAKVAERCSQTEMLYIFDIFILAVIEFSGYSLFVINNDNDYDIIRRKELFPQAFNTLLCMNDWSVCTTQALEWLFHMNTEETVPSEYRNIFGLTLWSLRHDEEFRKNLKWMKYLSSKVIIINSC